MNIQYSLVLRIFYAFGIAFFPLDRFHDIISFFYLGRGYQRNPRRFFCQDISERAKIPTAISIQCIPGIYIKTELNVKPNLDNQHPFNVMPPRRKHQPRRTEATQQTLNRRFRRCG